MVLRLRVVYLAASFGSLGRDILAIVIFGAGTSTDAVYLGLLPFLVAGSLVAVDSLDSIVQPVLAQELGDAGVTAQHCFALRAWGTRISLVLMILASALLLLLLGGLWLVRGEGTKLAALAAMLSIPGILLSVSANVKATLLRRDRKQLGVGIAVLAMNVSGGAILAISACLGVQELSIALGYLGSAVVYWLLVGALSSRHLPSTGTGTPPMAFDEGDFSWQLNTSAVRVMLTSSLGHLNVIVERFAATMFGPGVLTAVQYGRKFCMTAGSLLAGMQAAVDFPEWTRRGEGLSTRSLQSMFGLGVAVGVLIGVTFQFVPMASGGEEIARAAVAFGAVLPLYCLSVYVQRYLYSQRMVGTVALSMVILAVLPPVVMVAAGARLGGVYAIACGFGLALLTSLAVFAVALARREG